MIKKLNSRSNLTQRIVAALIGVPLIIFCTFYNQYSFWLLFSTLAILTQYEFYKLLGLSGNFPLKIYGCFCGLVMTTLVFFVETHQIGFDWYYLLVPLLTLTFFIKLYKKKDARPFENLGYTFLGIIYVSLPFSLLMEVVLDQGDFRPMLALGILIVLWVNDSGRIFREEHLEKENFLSEFHQKKHGKVSLGEQYLLLLQRLFFIKPLIFLIFISG